MAPDLHVVLRKCLEQQEIKSQVIDSYLEENPSIKRYNSAFKSLYSILSRQGISPMLASTNQVVSGIIELHKASPAQARNAYSAVLLLPNLGGVRFHPLLRKFKQLWNSNMERYASFWDCRPLIARLAKAAGADSTPQAQQDHLHRMQLADLRSQLILVSRLLCLFRSVDLANVQRCYSLGGGKQCRPLHHGEKERLEGS